MTPAAISGTPQIKTLLLIWPPVALFALRTAQPIWRAFLLRYSMVWIFNPGTQVGPPSCSPSKKINCGGPRLRVVKVKQQWRSDQHCLLKVGLLKSSGRKSKSVTPWTPLRVLGLRFPTLYLIILISVDGPLIVFPFDKSEHPVSLVGWVGHL